MLHSRRGRAGALRLARTGGRPCVSRPRRAADAGRRGEGRQAPADGGAPAGQAAGRAVRRQGARAGQVRRRPAHADGQGPRHPHDGRVRVRAARRVQREAGVRSRPPGELRERRRPRLHVSSPPRAPVVGRSPVHLRGLPLLLGGHRQQQGAVAARPAQRAAGERQGAARHLPRPAHRPLHVGRAESAVPPGARRAVAALHLPSGALPQAVPRPPHRRGQGEGARRREEGAQLGRAAPQEGRAVPLRQSRPADARALGQPDRAAGDALRLPPQPLLPPRRPGGTAAALHRPRADRHRRREARAGEDRRRRGRPAGPLPALRRLHVPEEEREAQRLRRAALGNGEGLADRAVPEPQHRGPGVADR